MIFHHEYPPSILIALLLLVQLLILLSGSGNLWVLPPERPTRGAELAGRVELMLAQDREHWEENLVDELEKRVILYEEDHPVIARVIRQIIVTLNNMGL